MFIFHSIYFSFPQGRHSSASKKIPNQGLCVRLLRSHLNVSPPFFRLINGIVDSAPCFTIDTVYSITATGSSSFFMRLKYSIPGCSASIMIFVTDFCFAALLNSCHTVFRIPANSGKETASLPASSLPI